MQPIYIDNSATTPSRPEVLEAMEPYLQGRFGNASSIHAIGREARQALDAARAHVAQLIGCESKEVYFAPCGTMANNVALLGRARFIEANGLPKRLLISAIEHSSILGPAQFLGANGFKLDFIRNDKHGLIDLDHLQDLLRDPCGMVSIMWANNEIGTVQPIAQIAQMIQDASKAQGHDIFLHSDAVQATGKLPIDLSSLGPYAGVHALSLSGHKFGAPKGIGALFVRKLVNLMPIYFGGGQEMGLFPGTEAMSQIVGLGEAARLARLELDDSARVLRSYQSQVMERLATMDGVVITGPQDLAQRLPGHVSFAQANRDGEALVLKSDLKGIAISAGSACHRGIIEPSHVIKALALPEKTAMGAVRMTFGKSNTQDDVTYLLDKLPALLSS